MISGTLSYAAFGNDGYTHVYLYNSGNGSVTQLTSGSSNDETPEWSFDGTKLTFLRADTNGNAAYVMHSDGSGLTRLSPTPGRDMLPGFSPDGSKVVFSYVVNPTGCNGGTMPLTSIMTMSATNGSNRTTIVDGSVVTTCFNMEPRFSPDGSKIVFMCGPSNSGVQICTVNADGSGYSMLTHTSGTIAGDPHWSWDGQKIGLSRRDVAGNVNVWSMNADGSNLIQLTHFVDPQEGGDVGWSLDNSDLVFEEDVGGGGQSSPTAPAKISVVSADGSSYRSLNVSCSGIGCAPRFKP